MLSSFTDISVNHLSNGLSNVLCVIEGSWGLGEQLGLDRWGNCSILDAARPPRVEGVGSSKRASTN